MRRGHILMEVNVNTVTFTFVNFHDRFYLEGGVKGQHTPRQRRATLGPSSNTKARQFTGYFSLTD